MRETDNNRPEVANLAKPATQRFHRGAMGQVLQRYLSQHRPQQEYSLVRLEQLWQQAAELDPAIGLHLFSLFTPADWHPLAHLSQFCRNIGESLHCWQRYVRLGSDMDQVRLSECDDGIVLELLIDAPAELERFLIEHYTVMALTLMRQGSGQALANIRTEFRHAPPSYQADYLQLLGHMPRFNAPRNGLYLQRSDLAIPMRQHHPVLAELICEGLDRRLARLQHLSGWAARVAEQVRSDLQHERPPSLESAASAMAQSPRTLRRRLQEQGMGFREVLDAVRAELEQGLELQGLNSSQIAAQLGYADSPAYLHARKRWREPKQP